MESEVLFRRNVTEDQALNRNNWSEWDANCIYFTTNNTIVMNGVVYSGKSTVDLIIKGDWDKESAYVQNNIVYHNNNSYICLQNISQPKAGDVPIEPGTTRGESYWGLFSKAANFYISTTYAELKIFIGNSSLIPGCKYRITDYYTSYDCSNTKTKGDDITNQNYTVGCTNHRFDVVVTATSENTLSSDASARHNANDTYFDKCDVESWQLKYNINNDISLSKLYYNGSALTPNGNGIIYRMIDEYGNDLPFDFKNVRFKRIDQATGSDESQWLFLGGNVLKRMSKSDFITSKYNDIDDLFASCMFGALIDNCYLKYSTLGNNTIAQPCPHYDNGYLYMDVEGIGCDYIYQVHDILMHAIIDPTDSRYPSSSQPMYNIPGTKMMLKMGTLDSGDCVLDMTPWFYVFSIYNGEDWEDRTVVTNGSECTARNNKFNPSQPFENTVFLGSALNNTFNSSIKDSTFSGGFENNTFLYDCVANAFMAEDSDNCTKNCNFDYIHNSVFIGKHEYNTFSGENHDFFILGNSSHNEFKSCYNILGYITELNKFEYCSFGHQCHDIRVSDAYSCTLGSECNHINIGMYVTVDDVEESVSTVIGTVFVVEITWNGKSMYKSVDIAAKSSNISIYSENNSNISERCWSVRVEPGVVGNCMLAEWDDPRNYYDVFYKYSKGSQLSEILYKISQKGTVVETEIKTPEVYVASGSFNMTGRSVRLLDGSSFVTSSVWCLDQIGNWAKDIHIPNNSDALGYASYPVKINPINSGNKMTLDIVNIFSPSSYYSETEDNSHQKLLKIFRMANINDDSTPYDQDVLLTEIPLFVGDDTTPHGDGVPLSDYLIGKKIWFEIPKISSATDNSMNIILFIPAANTDVLKQNKFRVDYTIERT